MEIGLNQFSGQEEKQKVRETRKGLIERKLDSKDNWSDLCE
mgnify:CR=1 FL=1